MLSQTIPGHGGWAGHGVWAGLTLPCLIAVHLVLVVKEFYV